MIGPPPRNRRASPAIRVRRRGQDARRRTLGRLRRQDGDGTFLGRDASSGKRPPQAPGTTPAGGTQRAAEPFTLDKSASDVWAPPLSKPEQYGDFSIVDRSVAGRSGGLRIEHAAPLDPPKGRRDGHLFPGQPRERRAYEPTAPSAWRAAGPSSGTHSAGVRDLPEYGEAGGPRVRSAALRAAPVFLCRLPDLGGGPGQIGGLPDLIAGLRRGRRAQGFVAGFLRSQVGRARERRIPDPSRTGSAGPKPASSITRDVALMQNLRLVFAGGGGSAGPARTWLDLGTVKDLARVRLNGRDLDVVWCAPWRVDISGAVKPKGNELEIAVANLWPNRLIGDEPSRPPTRVCQGRKPVALAGLAPPKQAQAELGQADFLDLEAVFEGLAAPAVRPSRPSEIAIDAGLSRSPERQKVS